MTLPVMISNKVVFPVPFRPMTAMRSLIPTVKLSPLKSSCPLYDLETPVTVSILSSYGDRELYQDLSNYVKDGLAEIAGSTLPETMQKGSRLIAVCSYPLV